MKRPWSRFFWQDWESDEGLRMCSLAAQGLWMRLLCICAKGDPYGYLSIRGEALGVKDIAHAVGRSETEVEPLLAELDRWRVFSRDRKGRIYSRRMLRDIKHSQNGRKHAEKRWSQTTEKKEEKPDPNGLPRGSPKRDPCTPISYDASKGNTGGSSGSNEPSETTSRSDPAERSAEFRLEAPSNRAQPRQNEAEFQRWYQTYPRHKAVAQARKAYWRARKKADAETLLRGAERACREFANRDPDKIPYPATWLNGEQWLNQPDLRVVGSDLDPDVPL